MCYEGGKKHDDPENKRYDGTTYVKGRYLEFDSMNNKCYVYKVSKSMILVAV